MNASLLNFRRVIAVDRATKDSDLRAGVGLYIGCGQRPAACATGEVGACRFVEKT
jgi:hypothetical protein